MAPATYPRWHARLARTLNVATDLAIIGRLCLWITVDSLPWYVLLLLWSIVAVLWTPALYLSYRLFRGFRVSLWVISTPAERWLGAGVLVAAALAAILAPHYRLFSLGTLFGYGLFMAVGHILGHQQAKRQAEQPG